MGEFSDVAKQLLLKKKKTTKYSEELRDFSLSLHFYSPRAYEFLRGTFTLPSPSTLRTWLGSFGCLPGFQVIV